MESIFSLVVVGIMLIFVIIISIKDNEKSKLEDIERELKYKEIERKIDYYSKIGVMQTDNIDYKIGQWENEVREGMESIIKISDRYQPNKKVSVLVGDYNKSSVSNTVCILESMGIDVNIAKSGAEIIKRIENNEKYDLIISNNIYDRGHYDGPQMLQKLKEIKSFNIPVIVLTVSENKRHLFMGEFGFDEYMTKLLTQGKVLETLPKVIKDLKFTKIQTKSNKS